MVHDSGEYVADFVADQVASDDLSDPVDPSQVPPDEGNNKGQVWQ